MANEPEIVLNGSDFVQISLWMTATGGSIIGFFFINTLKTLVTRIDEIAASVKDGFGDIYARLRRLEDFKVRMETIEKHGNHSAAP